MSTPGMPGCWYSASKPQNEMHIQLYIDDQLLHEWHRKDVGGPLDDQASTEARKREWERLAAECRREVEKDYPDLPDYIQMAVQIRSRMAPRNIPPAEYRRFTEMVTANMSRKTVGRKRPGVCQ